MDASGTPRRPATRRRRSARRGQRVRRRPPRSSGSAGLACRTNRCARRWGDLPGPFDPEAVAAMAGWVSLAAGHGGGAARSSFRMARQVARTPAPARPGRRRGPKPAVPAASPPRLRPTTRRRPLGAASAAGLSARVRRRFGAKPRASFTARRIGRDASGAARRALEAADVAEASASSRQAPATGTVRLAASIAFGRLHFAPRPGRLFARHPEPNVALRLSDGFVDLIDDGADVAGGFRLDPALSVDGAG